MPDDRPPILQYASTPSVIRPQPSPTLLFGGGVLFGCCIYYAIAFQLGEIDIPIGPMCDCVATPAFAAGIFRVSAAARAKLFGTKLTQRNSYAIFALGIGAFVTQLAIGTTAGILGGDKWHGPVLVLLLLSLPAVSAWIAFRPPTADRG